MAKKYILILGAYSDLAKNSLKYLLDYNLILVGKDHSKLSKLKSQIKKTKVFILSNDIADEKLGENIFKICKKKKNKNLWCD